MYRLTRVDFFTFLEVPLNRKCWVNEELLIVVGIIDEVVTNLHLCTNAEMLGSIIPELRLRKNNQLSMTICLLTTPEINKARESAFSISKVQTPYTSKLGRIVSRCIVVTLKEALTLGSKASTAPASRKQAALVMSRLIFFIAIVVLEITDCKDTTFFELTHLIYLFYSHFCFFSFVFHGKEFRYRIFVVTLPPIVE